MIDKKVKAVSMVWLSKTGLTNLNSGEGGANLVDVKKYRWNREEYPYVSGQAMRFYFKEAIRRKIAPEEACIPDQQGETCGQIDKCILCDIFGFMTTLPDIGAKTRISPVKVSPAIGLIPLSDTLINDFLTRKYRGLEAGEMRGDIVNVELSVNIYKSGICIDIHRIGCEEEVVEIEKIKGKKPKSIQSVIFKSYVSEDEQARRIGLLFDAIKDFSDYSKQARLLTDFTPDLILIGLQTNYSHRLQKAFELESENRINLSIRRLEQILSEIKSETTALFAGMLDGVIENADKVKTILENKGIPVFTPHQAIDEAKRVLLGL